MRVCLFRVHDVLGVCMFRVRDVLVCVLYVSETLVCVLYVLRVLLCVSACIYERVYKQTCVDTGLCACVRSLASLHLYQSLPSSPNVSAPLI